MGSPSLSPVHEATRPWYFRARDRWSDVEWPVVTAVLAFTLIIGYIGIAQHLEATGASHGFVDIVYVDIQLFALQISGAVDQPGYPWPMDVARILAPLVTSYTALRGLMLVFRDRVDTFLARFSRRHVVVAGLGEKGLMMARGLRARGMTVVAIDPDGESEHRAAARELRIRFIEGDARAEGALRRANAKRATTVIAAAADDGVNAAIAVVARRFAEGRDEPLQCLAHITDPELCNLLRVRELSIGRAHAPFRLDFFNTEETAARLMLLEHVPDIGAASDVVVVGSTGVAEHVVVAAARLRRAQPSVVRRLRIHLVDDDPAPVVESLAARHPLIVDACDVRAVAAPLGSAAFSDGAFLFHDGAPVDAVFACLPDDGDALSAALTLHRVLADQPTPVVVQTTDDSGLASLLRADRAGFETVHAFATYERTCDPEVLLRGTSEMLARAMHDAYVAKEVALGRSRVDNPSMVDWDELPEALRESNRDQAAHIGVKLEAAGCTLERLVPGGETFRFDDEEIERLAELEHERWNRDRERNGWTHGPVKDTQRKITPHLVPWNDLSEEIKGYDRDTVERLPGFLATLGYQIRRVS